MQKLHLLGFTTDLKGIVFARRRGAKKAAFWVPVDESFRAAVAKLEDARLQAAGEEGRAAEEPRVVLPPIGRSASTIPASEIQQLLREGRTIETVAKTAKVSLDWVERLADPVLTERVGVVRLAHRAHMSRPRLGRSGLPLGQAVRTNLEERRATMSTLETLDDGWDARATRSGPWRVRLRFSHRGSRRVAEWDYVKSTGVLSARNRLASELGWTPPPPEAREAAKPPAEGEEEAPEPEAPKRRQGSSRKPTRKGSGASRRPRGTGRRAGPRRRRSGTAKRRTTRR